MSATVHTFFDLLPLPPRRRALPAGDPETTSATALCATVGFDTCLTLQKGRAQQPHQHMQQLSEGLLQTSGGVRVFG